MAYKRAFMLPVENRIGSIKDPSKLQTVSMELKVDFEKKVIEYTKSVQRALSGENFYGLALGMPSKNLNDIKDDFIKKGELELSARGFKRAKSISRATFEQLLDVILLDIENNENLGK